VDGALAVNLRAGLCRTDNLDGPTVDLLIHWRSTYRNSSCVAVAEVADWDISKLCSSWNHGAMSPTGSSGSDSRHRKMVCVFSSFR